MCRGAVGPAPRCPGSIRLRFCSSQSALVRQDVCQGRQRPQLPLSIDVPRFPRYLLPVADYGSTTCARTTNFAVNRRIRSGSVAYQGDLPIENLTHWPIRVLREHSGICGTYLFSRTTWLLQFRLRASGSRFGPIPLIQSVVRTDFVSAIVSCGQFVAAVGSARAEFAFLVSSGGLAPSLAWRQMPAKPWSRSAIR